MKTLLKIISNIIIAVIALLAILLVLPRIFGLKPLVVLSGSMEPTYHVGSLIYTGKAKPEELKTGDAITYYLSDNETMVTHRIIEIDAAESVVYTQGDANDAADGGAVKFSSIVGKPLVSVPYLGYLAQYFKTKSGMIVLITALVAAVLLICLTDLLSKEDK